MGFRHSSGTIVPFLQKTPLDVEKEVPPAGVQGQKPRYFFIGQERLAKVKQYVFT